MEAGNALPWFCKERWPTPANSHEMITWPRLRALFVVTCVVASAATAGHTTQLVYEREPLAESCPPQAEFARVLASKVSDLSFSDSAYQALQIRFSKEGDRFLAVAWLLRENRVSAERRVSPPGSDCQAAFDAIAFSVAVALLAEPVKRIPLRVDDERRGPSDRSATLVSAPLDTTYPTGIRLALGGHCSAGTSFGPTGGVAVEASWRRADLLLGAGLSQEVWSLHRHDQGLLRGGLTTATVHACYRLAGPIRACGLVSAGLFFARAEGLPEARSVRTPYLAIGPRIDFEAPLPNGWAVVAQLDALAPLTRTRLTVGELETWSTPPLGARLFVGVATSFGDGFLRPPQ